jgi:hypothetical protein
MFRPDAWVMGSMATAQWIALLSIGVAAAILVVRHIGWQWRKHPEDSMIYMTGRPAPPRKPAAAAV